MHAEVQSRIDSRGVSQIRALELPYAPNIADLNTHQIFDHTVNYVVDYTVNYAVDHIVNYVVDWIVNYVVDHTSDHIAEHIVNNIVDPSKPLAKNASLGRCLILLRPHLSIAPRIIKTLPTEKSNTLPSCNDNHPREKPRISKITTKSLPRDLHHWKLPYYGT
ncbi:uncharacterized protein PG986_009694 [Apiospora aurea]|uniref:Uncharacterized protein n=1 Tax=Apiospora aurea TaxID=335848 RepID=A0ABR1Q8P8_9PEZI